MADFEALLSGGDLRSIGNSHVVAARVKTQPGFDALFSLMQHPDRRPAMRAADAIEKITRKHPEFLTRHKPTILRLLATASHKELKWHLAQLLPRLPLTEQELQSIWQQLYTWAGSPAESKIVRVNALQALSDLAHKQPVFGAKLAELFAQAELENISSLTTRIKKLKLQQAKQGM